MRFAGKSFIAGFAGSLGVLVGGAALAAVLTHLGERAIRKAINEYTEMFSEVTEQYRDGSRNDSSN